MTHLGEVDAWLEERKLWVPPMRFVGDGPHDHGLQHELHFKGVRREDVLRVDYVALER